ncbi:aldose epimerase family protein [Lacticaseibacillus jixiensis]|uniref:aldose epimerase family protein n=1 Tax=Lacticaseibacillus jixiensis TaxID=3231926 RepID=UPI0036F44157
MSSIELFGEVDGQAVHRLTVENEHGMRLSCLTYAALWYSLEVPVNGEMRNLIVNSPSVADYVDAPSYLGKSIGRTGGRIPKGEWLVDGQLVHLPTNEGNNTLHGGVNGFHSVVWYGVIDDNVIQFTKHFDSVFDGYPGDLDATITYTLTEDDQVLIDYTAISTAKTLFNPTSHVYFNLNGSEKDIGNQSLFVDSHERLELDDEKLPTGKLISLENSPYNFFPAHRIAETLNALATTPENGIDDVYVIAEHSAKAPIAKLALPEVSVAIYSDRNGLVLYTGNSFDATGKFVNYAGRPHIGVALEAQTLPNAVNDPHFGDITLDEGSRHEQIRYQVTYQR